MSEQVIQGWDNIAKFFGVSKRAMQRRRQELLDAGVIFYVLKGRPKRKVVCAFPSLLKVWASLKARKGEIL